MSEEENYQRNTPINELDLQFMTIDTEWGKDIQPELKAKLKILGDKSKKTFEGKYHVSEEELWGLLSYYTRDMRLGNLQKEDYWYGCQWLDFAGDCLRLGLVKSFLTALSRVITALELSQSRGGFLRNNLVKRRNEHYHEFNEEKKKGIFGQKKQRRDE